MHSHMYLKQYDLITIVIESIGDSQYCHQSPQAYQTAVNTYVINIIQLLIM